MLRISTTINEQDARFKLEGKLAHEWVEEAAKAWSAFLETAINRAGLVVDLCAVSFVDDNGRALLTQMHANGAKLIGAGPLIGSLIEEIYDCKSNGDNPLASSKWMKGIVSILLFLILANILFGEEKPKNEVLSLDRATPITVPKNGKL